MSNNAESNTPESNNPESNTPGGQLSEEPQSERGDIGSRDTGSDHPEAGQTDRPSGSFDDDSVPSHGDSEDQEKVYGGTGELPPKNAEAATPPYDGRQERARATDDVGAKDTGANTGGAGQPTDDPEYKAPKPDATPGGATASPADEQPAEQAPETEASADGVDVAHQAGVRRPEDQPRET